MLGLSGPERWEKASQPPGNRIPIFDGCRTCKFAKFDNALCTRSVHINDTIVLCCNTKVRCLQIHRVAFINCFPICRHHQVLLTLHDEELSLPPIRSLLSGRWS